MRACWHFAPPGDHNRGMKRLALLLAAGLLLVGVAACGSGSDDSSSTTTAGDGGSTATTTADGAPDTANLPTFDTVTAIGDALGCQLDYEGISDQARTYSTCVFNDEQAFIYVYNDPSDAAAVAATGDTGLVVGGNWTVQVETDDNAQAVADATGGQVASTGSSTSTTAAA